MYVLKDRVFNVKWRSDFDKACVVVNFERRGWHKWKEVRNRRGERASERRSGVRRLTRRLSSVVFARAFAHAQSDQDDWNIYWASVYSTKQVFSADSHIRLGDHQLINHFPNHYEITRKDLMVKNMKRYRKEMIREGRDASVLDFVPTTFVLPGDYALFAEEYRKQPNTTLILKPSARAQGKGIFLINKLSQVRKWYATQVSLRGPRWRLSIVTCPRPFITTNTRADTTVSLTSSLSQWPGAIKVNSSDAYVVSKYIQNPLLVGDKKFDLRLYVCVRSYRPLQAYKSSLCFARFCNFKYTEDEDDLDNAFVHLTNVAVQKHSDSYNENHGSKWPLESLKFYLQSNYGLEKTTKLMEDIDMLIIHTLKACQAVMINDRHCFELYGYDIIVDDALKPWLIEVNASPSLSATTQADRVLKFQLINDTLKCVAPKHWSKGGHGGSKGSSLKEGARPNFVQGGASPLHETGSFTLLYDEVSQQQERLRLKRELEKSQEDRPRWTTWGSSASVSSGGGGSSSAPSGRRAFSAGPGPGRTTRTSFRH